MFVYSNLTIRLRWKQHIWTNGKCSSPREKCITNNLWIDLNIFAVKIWLKTSRYMYTEMVDTKLRSTVTFYRLANHIFVTWGKTIQLNEAAWNLELHLFLTDFGLNGWISALRYTNMCWIALLKWAVWSVLLTSYNVRCFCSAHLDKLKFPMIGRNRTTSLFFCFISF